MDRASFALVVAATAALVSGCGPLYYASNVTSASSKVEQAQVAGAEQYAPYEYYYAKAHLEQAQVEASEASYSDAANFAETAEEYALKAIELSEAARRKAVEAQASAPAAPPSPPPPATPAPAATPGAVTTPEPAPAPAP